MTGLIVRPEAGWIASPRADDEREEQPSRHELARFALARERSELQRVLGVLFVNTTLLPTVNGGFLGPAKDHEGRVLRWSVWAPHRRVLIDAFPRGLPAQQELDARRVFADANDLRYAIVERGKKLTAKSVKEWLDG